MEGSRLTGLTDLDSAATLALGDTDRENKSVLEGKYQIARCDLSHRLVKRIACAVGIAFRRPKIAALHLLAVRLVLIDPPIAHRSQDRRRRHLLGDIFTRYARVGNRGGAPFYSAGPVVCQRRN
jgi:hypothetical protein